jgi:ferredoxin-NADP reductase
VSASRVTVFAHAIRAEADDVLSVDLRPVEPDAQLPVFTPGAHIDLHLPIGVRCYSLTNPTTERHRYVIAVGLATDSRGGSEYVHRQLSVGARLQISHPRNLFALDESARHSVLIAGGIGITPIRCMFHHLRSMGRSLQLLYCARTRRRAAFAQELAELSGVHLHIDDEVGAPIDLIRFMDGFDAGTVFYCCGPAPLLAAFERAGQTLGIEAQRLHLERFAPAEQPDDAAGDGAFTVQLARNGLLVSVRRDQSILDALLAAGVNAEFSCQQGICGACETTVLEGIPEHRDFVLSEAERGANKSMMICVSGCRGARLVLDL